VKIIGLFQGLIALLIVFGDSLGAILLVSSLLTKGIINYHHNILDICQWKACDQWQVIFTFISLVCSICHAFGIGLDHDLQQENRPCQVIIQCTNRQISVTAT
jgi:hypothetical protein